MDKLQLNTELTLITSEIEALEVALKGYAVMQQKYEDFRTRLFDIMTESEVDKYTSPGGIQFTVVAGTPEKIEILLKFNEDKFKKEHADMYSDYTEQAEKISKARVSYLRITTPKEKEE